MENLNTKRKVSVCLGELSIQCLHSVTQAPMHSAASKYWDVRKNAITWDECWDTKTRRHARPYTALWSLLFSAGSRHCAEIYTRKALTLEAAVSAVGESQCKMPKWIVRCQAIFRGLQVPLRQALPKPWVTVGRQQNHPPAAIKAASNELMSGLRLEEAGPGRGGRTPAICWALADPSAGAGEAICQLAAASERARRRVNQCGLYQFSDHIFNNFKDNM